MTGSVSTRRANSRRTAALLLALMLAPLCLTAAGCWDRTEPDEQLHVLSGFLDLETDGTLRLTTEVLSLMVGGGEGGSATHSILSATGRGILETLWNMRWLGEAPPNVAHMSLLVIGEDLARQGLRPITDALTQNYQIRRTMLIAVTPGKASDLLSAELVASRHSELLLGMLRGAQEGAGEVALLQLNDFVRALGTEGVDPLVAQFIMAPAAPVEHAEEHSQATVPRMEDEGGGGGGGGADAPRQASLRGAAIFRDDRLVGFANSHEALGLTWLRAPVRGLVMWVPTGPVREGFSVRVSNSAPRFRVSEVGGRLQVDCQVTLECDIGELLMDEEMFTPEDLDRIGKRLATHVEGQISGGLAYAIEVLGTDPVGLGRYLSRHQPQTWVRLREDWPNALLDADTSIRVETQIITTGMLFRRQVPPAARQPAGGP